MAVVEVAVDAMLRFLLTCAFAVLSVNVYAGAALNVATNLVEAGAGAVYLYVHVLFTCAVAVCPMYQCGRSGTFDADPDPTFHADAGPDLDPTFHADADPDPTSHADADPDPAISGSKLFSYERKKQFFQIFNHFFKNERLWRRGEG